MIEQAKDINDYLAILRRRRKNLILPLFFIFPLSIILAFSLPTIYQSTATIMIEEQEIPEELVRSTVTGYAEVRLAEISRRVLTHSNLKSIADKLGLLKEFAPNADDMATEAFLGEMKNNIGAAMTSANVNDKIGSASIAFDLTYDSEIPETAQKIVSELVTLYLKENVKIRTQRAELTTEFLATEAESLNQQITLLEEKLAKYKERNVGRLPQQMQLNMNLMERSERELEETERQIYAQEEKKAFTVSQLAQVEPFTGTNPATRLRLLQSQYIQASATYSPDHPDLQKMKREIDILKRETGQGDDIDALQKQLRGAKDDLEYMNKRYATGHPDIVKLKKVIKTLNVSINNAEISGGSTVEVKPDNPPYIALSTQLEGILIQMKALKEKRSRLKEKLTLYETRIMEIPGVEQEGLSLERDYDNAVEKYKEVKQKLMQAEIGKKLESEQKAERFSLIEPASLPSKPEKPNRPAIIFLGFALSIIGGMGYAAIAEFMDQTVRGAKAITALLKVAPLTVIPNVRREKGDSKNKNYLYSVIVLLVIVIAVVIYISMTAI